MPIRRHVPPFDHQWMRPRRCGKRVPEIAGPYADHRSWPIAVPAPECRDVAHGRPWPRNDARDHSGSWKEYASRGADRRRGTRRHVRDSAVDPVEGFFRSLVELQWQWQSSMPCRWVWPQVALCHLLRCGTEIVRRNNGTSTDLPAAAIILINAYRHIHQGHYHSREVRPRHSLRSLHPRQFGWQPS